MEILTKNQIFTARVEGYSSEGLGVVRHEGAVVFVQGAISGEEMDVRVVKAGKGASFGRIERLIEPSPERIAPACPIKGCGGCDLGHMSYAEELRFKRRRVADAMERIGGIGAEVLPVIPSESTCGYRNKAVFNAGMLDGRPVLGFYRQRSHDVVPAEGCLIQFPEAGAAAGAVRLWMEENRVSVYDEAAHKGLVRSVFTRGDENALQVCVVINGKTVPAPGRLVEAVRAAVPKTAGVLLNLNTARGNTVMGGEFRVLWGDESLETSLCGLKFRVSPASFYQVNAPQARRLYETALSLAGGLEGKTVLDLYCGIGTISLCLAKTAKRVIGAEIVPQAVENARENARLNGLENAEFILADAGAAAEMLSQLGERPDIITIDPPRKGLGAGVVDIIAGMEPEKIVYISCDCATMARDMKRFAQLGYKAPALQPVDMFPRTRHVETIVLLQREIS